MRQLGCPCNQPLSYFNINLSQDLSLGLLTYSFNFLPNDQRSSALGLLLRKWCITKSVDEEQRLGPLLWSFEFCTWAISRIYQPYISTNHTYSLLPRSNSQNPIQSLSVPFD
ncbi:hypothetical protein AG1IA_01192 [Rhizoctonia solani AG-1 IA]|uniref:Uncharacterized protein n=1 Tax=Thanatephorus cucumeris (strain AG1-IA) TaxID=983506 RepID=L8X6V7_THACA|nr:hypothetical protein AG1IA_01192 [Rhizoctonia solani AG-1 IA]